MNESIKEFEQEFYDIATIPVPNLKINLETVLQ